MRIQQDVGISPSSCAAGAERPHPARVDIELAVAGAAPLPTWPGRRVGTVWDHGTRLADARGRRGAGAGVFLLASLFQLSLDVGIRQGGGAHVHFSTGLQF